ncbi:hypothetical protein KC669_00940 [Candidatus Dojkabacteria bacterium]|uniref:Uncharacterized protein n=1 Tax=Candidatus Dojkabacteria bacterium TaxID=2099670 RepID=A0A955RLP5_9BACT|nr:hypothetical protein [Candidatus Dojkabacteria bacterium]
MRKEAPWLFYGIIVVAMVLFVAFLSFLFIDRKWDMVPFKYVLEETSHQEVYDNLTIDETFSVKANFDFPLFEEAGFLFPELDENSMQTYVLDFLNGDQLLDETKSDLENSDFTKSILGDTEQIKIWQKIIDQYNFKTEETSDLIYYKLTDEGAETFLKLELKSFINERFIDSIQPEEIVINSLKDPSVEIMLDKKTNQVSTFAFSVDQIEIQVVFDSEDVDLLISTLELNSSTVGKISISNYSYSANIVDYKLNADYKTSLGFFDRLKLAIFN